MERTKKVKADAEPAINIEVSLESAPLKKLASKEITKIPIRPKLKYRLNGGTLKIFGRTYQRNEIIEAYPEEIPEGFRNSLTCLNLPEEIEAAKAPELKMFAAKENLYVISPAKAANWWNVINEETGKQLNEKPLRKADAEKLKDSLNG